MPNFKISPLYTSEVEVVTMNSPASSFRTLKSTQKIFMRNLISALNVLKAHDLRRWTIFQMYGRTVAVTDWSKPGGKQWKDDLAQDLGTEEEALPSCIELSMHYAAIDAMKGARERVLKGNHNLWCKSPLIRMCFIDLSKDLGSSATDPDYRGKGTGRMVMQWGIEQEDKDLETAPTG